MPGLTNRKIGRFVRRALLSFPDAARFFPPGKSEITGLPVRPEFFKIAPKQRDGQADHSDHRRQPGIADAERGRARQLELFSRGSVSGPVHSSNRDRGACRAGAKIRRKRNGGRGGAVHRRHAGGVCARRPGHLPRGSGSGGGIGGRRQAVHPGSLAHRRRPASAAQRGSVPEGRGVGADCSIRKWMADGCLKKWRNCARIRNCYIAWESGLGLLRIPMRRAARQMCWKKRLPVDIALESRNNTRLKCFLSRNTCTSSESAALA